MVVDVLSSTDHDGGLRCIFEVRRMIPAELVLDPAVDMLLAMVLASDRTNPMHVDDICTFTGASAEACRHWGKALRKSGLVCEQGVGYLLTDEGYLMLNRINGRVWRPARHHMGVSQAD